MSSERTADAANEVRFEFESRDGRIFTNLILSFFAVVVFGFGFIALGLWLDFPEPILNKRIITIAVGVIAAVLGSMLFVMNFRARGQRVLVYSDGFRFHSPGFEDFFRWDEIVDVRQDSSRIGQMRSTNLSIQMNDGRKVYLSWHLNKIETLTDIILSETRRRRLPVLMCRLQNDETIYFGELGMNADALIYGDKELAWRDVQKIEVMYGQICVRQKPDGREWFVTRVKAMPNYHIFLALAAEYFSVNE
jgi:hypothetical protein